MRKTLAHSNERRLVLPALLMIVWTDPKSREALPQPPLESAGVRRCGSPYSHPGSHILPFFVWIEGLSYDGKGRSIGEDVMYYVIQPDCPSV